MASNLLTTKVQIPPRMDHVVHRSRLVDALERAVPHYKLTLISAPAGYGKTTLLAEWARGSQFPVVWLSIDPEENDPERFLRYLLMGWEGAQPGISDSPLGMLLGTMMPDVEAVLTAFINAANDVSSHTVFVLDDYHLIEESSIHEALTFLLDHLPATLHFVLAGRGDPPLPLARYRARHELLEIRTGDLRFQEEETSAFLTQHMGLDLTPDEIVPLHAQMEGWIAGLQLVALTLQRRPNAADALVISGRHHFIADYLSEDVLSHLPEDMRRFMFQTSILDRLCGSLCNTVTGRDDGQEMLNTLERENLFLTPLDDSREWFRYHRLFRDVLHDELMRRHPDDVAGLHRRAARWYLEDGLPEPALHHAVAGDDVDLVVSKLDRYIFEALNSGEFRDVQRWLDSFPAAWYSVYPMLDLARAGLLAFTGSLEACVRCVDDVEERLSHAESRDTGWQMARVTAIRCLMACMQNDLSQAETYGYQALQDLPADDVFFRSGIYHSLGDVYRLFGHWEQARVLYLKVFDVSLTSDSRVEAAHVFGALADLDLRQGHLQDAAAHWRKALEAIQKRENWGRLPLPVIGWVHLRMGELLYEWNQLPDAWDHLSRGLERAELSGDIRAQIAGYLTASRLHLAQGNIQTAAEYLERARPLVEEASFPDWTSRFERCQLELWLAQDRLRSAVLWSDEMLDSDALTGRPESEIAQLAMARVSIVKGDAPSIDRALALLQRLLQASEAEGRMGIAIEALALQSLAHSRTAQRADVMISIEHALRLAEPEGYVRLFADLGLPMARLLQEARSREIMPEYVAQLLGAFGADLASSTPSKQAIPEPLTHREQQVLELVVAGLTNREISDRLFISAQTVKKHTGNIYGKLGVRSRTEAAARARELDILG